MGSLYTNDVRNYIKSRKWPAGLLYEVLEFDGFLRFKMYRDNFSSLDGEDQAQAAAMVKQVMEGIRASGIPIYLEVAAGNGLMPDN